MNFIVTGASRGIGFEIVLQLAESETNKVIALSRSDLSKLVETGKQLNGNTAIYPLTFDLKSDNNDQLVQLIESELGSNVDGLINNAGTLINKPMVELTRENWQEVFDVNVFGVASLIKSVKPYMGKKNKGHIVNIGSMGGFQGTDKFPGLSAYSSSKGALACMSECLAKEFENDNIYVNCLALGAVQTEMLAQAFPDYTAPLSAKEMGTFIADYVVNGHKIMNGKVLPVAFKN
ncbi:MAG: SDR family oxidoreductase [Deltaproteobacteria bacterium]|nr:SDR family oxidoreductase [Deltaproteobacteria bacterium]